MKQNANSNTALFLMELIVVIGFFSLVAVICVRLFVAASVSSTNSVNINQAIRAEESLAEVWTACDGDLRETAALFPGASLSVEKDATEGSLSLYFDGEWQPVKTQEESSYTVVLISAGAKAADLYGDGAAGAAVTAAITASSLPDGDIICSLRTDHYIGGAR